MKSFPIWNYGLIVRNSRLGLSIIHRTGPQLQIRHDIGHRAKFVGPGYGI